MCTQSQFYESHHRPIKCWRTILTAWSTRSSSCLNLNKLVNKFRGSQSLTFCPFPALFRLSACDDSDLTNLLSNEIAPCQLKRHHHQRIYPFSRRSFAFSLAPFLAFCSNLNTISFNNRHQLQVLQGQVGRTSGGSPLRRERIAKRLCTLTSMQRSDFT